MPNKLDLTDILLGKGVKQDERTFHKQIVNIHEFYLSGDIESSENYIQWFDTIRHASENDVVKIYINSPGGDVFTAIQFIRALKETSANVIMSVEGMCASAATMIMLCGESFEISEHSTFLFHTYSGGLIGKGHELHSQAQFEREWSIKLINDIYKNFLTSDEITKILDGADIWMSGEQVTERIKKRQEILEKESSEETEQIEDQPTKIKSKKKVKETQE